MNDFRSPPTSGKVGSGLGLMIVDDDAGVREMLEEWLSHQGFTVWPAASGEDALEIFRRRPEAIDVVLMDVRMPDLDGPQTLAELRAINPGLRCCFMSGGLGEHTQAALSNGSTTSFVRKPFQLDELVQSLLSLVRPRVGTPERV
jgi:two-component system, cell cycle sensor histidine kinase and response regulator CckA